jgi:hypothetical protein
MQEGTVALKSYFNGTQLTTNAIPFSANPLGTVLRVDHRCDAGQRTTQAVVVSALDADFEVSANGTTGWGASVDIGVVAGADVPSYHRQKTRKAAGSTSPIAAFNVLYGNVEAIPVAPSFVSGPTVSEVTMNSARVVATWTDANVGDTVTAKIVVKTAATTPTDAEWTAAPYFDGDEVFSGLADTSTYRVWVQLTDSGGLKTVSTVATFTTASDTTVPAWPSGNASLSVTAGSSSFLVDWADATDNVAVSGYEVSRSDNGSTGWSVIATPTSSTYIDDNSGAGFAAATTKYYRVRARDAVGNWSAYSLVVSATIPAGDTTAPTGPSSVSATAGNAQLTLAFSGASDDVGVTGYDVYISISSSTPAAGATPTASPSASPHTVTGLTNGTPYYCWVRAKDAAGNKGSWVAASQNASGGVTPVAWTLTSAGKLASSDFVTGAMGSDFTLIQNGATTTNNASSVKYQWSDGVAEYAALVTGSMAAQNRFLAVIDVTPDEVAVSEFFKPISVWQKATAPAAGNNATITPFMRFGIDATSLPADATKFIFHVYRKDESNNWVEMGSSNITTTYSDSTRYLIYVWSDGTTLFFAHATQAAPTTLLDWKNQNTNASLGTVLSAPLSSIYDDGVGSPWWFMFGDLYTDYSQAAPEWHAISVCKDNRLKVAGLANGQKVTLYDSNGTTVIGKAQATVGADGTAYIDCTTQAATHSAPINFTNGRSVVLKVYQSDGTTLVRTSPVIAGVYAGDTVTYG